ncbi:lipid-A-disaccharide kinase [Pseudopedobacter saltans DSM 12145]|uniref:Tetraacyldisaccharide 4'-kinase n=1 Tax=Pseudopedobacter saltans (strain ATCC 51119 / DSM 12145 / JCM 21818 / CCUG 39354 / LMG 10337 / NBRC 100064 / NCIMB 13643) TaxID=762903 RepID=F0SEL3_PSESL|nr:tetraacyldisaccharide 4'-kinase [Pseudopedobacter saltans]ADY51903.1 lipid-A-disaccharide kinase [Pseudopedobacter saltans DSM 12145]
MNYLRLLLLPISAVYGLVVWLRNRLYDFGVFSSTSFDLPVISVGNLEVGGSGKTPLTEYLIKLLSGYRLATLSRGYGRKTKGFRWVKEHDDSTLSGDEPAQIKNKFPAIDVSVCEDRVAGVKQLQHNHDLILLDDAYQHRAIKPGFNVLVFNYYNLNKLRFLLPAGNYRDLFVERKRADILLISKCPQQLNTTRRDEIIRKMKPLNNQKVVFSSIGYSNDIKNIFAGQLKPVNTINKDTHVLLITGIANPLPLVNEIRKYTDNIIHHFYPDHHLFSTKNMLKLVEAFQDIEATDKVIITTEKDAVRLNITENRKHIYTLPVYQWPIEIVFLDKDKSVFDQEILNYVISNKRSDRIH